LEIKNVYTVKELNKTWEKSGRRMRERELRNFIICTYWSTEWWCLGEDETDKFWGG